MPVHSSLSIEAPAALPALEVVRRAQELRIVRPAFSDWSRLKQCAQLEMLAVTEGRLPLSFSQLVAGLPPTVRILEVTDCLVEHAGSLQVPAGVLELKLSSNCYSEGPPAGIVGPTVHTLSLDGWAETAAPFLGGCPLLRNLTLSRAARLHHLVRYADLQALESLTLLGCPKFADWLPLLWLPHLRELRIPAGARRAVAAAIADHAPDHRLKATFC